MASAVARPDHAILPAAPFFAAYDWKFLQRPAERARVCSAGFFMLVGLSDIECDCLPSLLDAPRLATLL